MNALESFRSSMHAAGLNHAGHISADGRMCRFKAGDDSACNSWFVLFSGPPLAGAFGCWKRGIKERWCEREVRVMSRAEKQRLNGQWRRAEAERQRVEAERHAEAREESARILKTAMPVGSHAYLERKGVKAFGDLREHGGKLVMPLRDVSGELHSLQFVDVDGTKRFLTGGRISGCLFTLCDKAEGPLVLCEGYATGASICEATGFATVAGMNCGNLLAVAKALRVRWPDRELIVAADDDYETPGNPGRTKASEAARAVGAKLAVPRFKEPLVK
jgi:putative DNA primase/helicase